MSRIYSALMKSKNIISFVLYFAAIVLIVAGLIGSLLGSQSARSLEENIIDSDKRLLNQVHVSIESVMQQNNPLHFILLTDSSLQNFTENYKQKNIGGMFDAAQTLNGMFMANPYLVSVDIYYPTLDMVYIANSGVVESSRYYDREVLSMINSGHTEQQWIFGRSINDIHSAKSVDVITELFPLYYAKDEIFSVAIINLNTNFFADILSDLVMRKEMLLFVVDYENHLLGASTAWSPQIMNSALLPGSDMGREGYYHTSYGDRQMIVVFQRDPVRGWNYISVTPHSVMFGPSNSMKNISVMITVLGIIIGIMVSIFFSWHMYKPFFRIASKLGESKSSIKYIEDSIDRIQERNKNIEKTLEEYRPVMVSRFLSDLLRGYYRNSSDLAERMSHYNLSVDWGAVYCVYVVLLDKGDTGESKVSQEEFSRFCVYVLDILKREFSKEGTGMVLLQKESELVVIARIGKNGDTGLSRGVENTGRRLAAVITECMERVRMIGAGECATPEHLDTSYLQAQIALARRFTAENSRLIFYHKLPKGGGSYGYPQDAEERLVSAINRRRSDLAGEFLGQMLSIIYLSGEDNEAMRPYRIARIFDTVMKSLNDIEAPPARSGALSLYEEMLSSMHDENILRAWFADVIERSIGGTDDHGRVKEKCVSDEIAAYIQENFHDYNLSLDRLSGEFYFSTSYISRIFRDEIGLTIKQYITQIRMETAKDMLIKNRRARISDIGAAVGYPRSQSFLKQFKEYCGVTPSQYREDFREA